jgi:uncharacterized membrane protein
MGSRNALALTLASVSAIAAMVAMLGGFGEGPVARFGGLLLVLVLPGYALTVAMFPPGVVGTAERLVLSLGLSLAGTTLGGLVLHWTPGGLAPGSWAVLLGGATLAASFVGLLRGRDDANRAWPAVLDGSAIRHAALFGLAGLVVAGAFGVARAGALEDEWRNTHFTQLWILPTEDGGQPRLGVGISNREPAAASYGLRLEIDGRTVAEWPSIELEPGGSWTANALRPAAGADEQLLEAVLYRREDPAVAYRRVGVWLAAGGG